MNSVLEFIGVERAYKQGVPVLDGITFSMAAGEVAGLLGRNGAGKTTLIRIAMGMLKPQAGQVRVFGLDPARDAVEIKRRLGFVAEDQVLPAWARVQELIDFHRYLFPRWDEALERQLAERFELRRGEKIKNLSKGQARQVALLLAVCHRPELLVLDEPAGGLDPVVRREFLETSIELLNREGTAILFSSHHMGDVERLAGRVVLLDGGRVRIDSDLDQLRERHCVALVSKGAVSSAAVLEEMPGCLRARTQGESWHAVFAGDPAEVEQRIRLGLGSNGVRCSRVPLEELFIEFVGAQQ
ncbi:ABC transporter ATP-binding protein [Paludibaculum fermentans]|uniref:ABC transporter ATP-binding protein n=1 Tax=Paludibaculum fermentans TaxID=1473598 RepID=A0A7S7NUP2_PALFE|nr:ABC transporter ATP-binding protein [Paludibaculum fermentans]QOY90064.1 ABC transporter ATP-binding protein [Paludibaculum fermentans]